jgi:hypothetical protein
VSTADAQDPAQRRSLTNISVYRICRHSPEGALACSAGNAPVRRGRNDENMNRYDLSTATVADLLVDPEVIAIVERFRPGLSESEEVRSAADLTVDQALELARPYAKTRDSRRSGANSKPCGLRVSSTAALRRPVCPMCRSGDAQASASQVAGKGCTGNGPGGLDRLRYRPPCLERRPERHDHAAAGAFVSLAARCARLAE